MGADNEFESEIGFVLQQVCPEDVWFESLDDVEFQDFASRFGEEHPF